MRYSKLLIPTLREDPGEAEVISHRLMLRAGMIRKLSAGLYSYLPVGYRVLRKVEAIVREEMDRAGAQEVLFPIAIPSELWKETGRWEQYGKELLRFKDRHERDFCLGPTHEEVVTDLVRREIKSYRQLPVNIYQIQTKFRDEIRPRFGVMRAREFVMKDAYSFDADEGRAKESYLNMVAAYHRIFERCGLKFRAVEADSGLIGGSFSQEFMVLAATGEEQIVSCTNCSYAANMERAELKPIRSDKKSSNKPFERVKTPGKKSATDVAAFLKVPVEQLVKTLLYQAGDKADRQIVAVLVRGDHEVNEVKLKKRLAASGIQGEVALAGQIAVEQATGAPSGFSGPVGLKNVKILADQGVQTMTDLVVGGNEKDVHLIHVQIGRDFKADEFADLRAVQEGDNCPRCEGPVTITKGIEVGHTFMLGTKYSESMNAKFLDASGKNDYYIMGCYGIGVSRTVAAAIEQNHDSKGIIWPRALAPFQVLVLPVNDQSEKVMITAELIYGTLNENGIEVLMDDRSERPGVKFNDADLLGIPYQVIVGDKNLKEGLVELKERYTGEVMKIKTETVLDLVRKLVGERRVEPGG
jgi:prolyl-tRNA synthetase